MRIEAKEAPAPGAELAVITSVQAIAPSEFFKAGGSKAVLDALKEEVRKQAAALDISTETGRKAIASLAYKVARSKTALDEQGEKLGEDLRKAKEAIDAERRYVRGEMDALKDEVRKPLTDWENAEKNRLVAHESALDAIAEFGRFALQNWRTMTVDELIQRIESIKAEERHWEEFSGRAEKEKNAALGAIMQAIEMRNAEDAAVAERERIASEARERAIKEREEAAARAAKEEAERKAAEQARLAQEAAERERQRIENERIQAEARAKQAEAQRIAAEQEAARKLAEAEAQRKREAEQAEQRRIAEAQEAERKAKEAAAQAERDRQAAIEAERARVAEEKRREAEEAERRAKDKAHKAEVNREALAGLVKIGMSADHGKLIIAAIAKGEIAHVRIEY